MKHDRPQGPVAHDSLTSLGAALRVTPAVWVVLSKFTAFFRMSMNSDSLPEFLALSAIIRICSLAAIV